MVATRGRTFKRPWRGSCHSSKLKSSSAPIGRKDSWCFHGVGSSNAPLLGSTAAEGLQRIGRTSIATRWRFCGLPQSASCSENFVIPPDVFGQTLRNYTAKTSKHLVASSMARLSWWYDFRCPRRFHLGFYQPKFWSFRWCHYGLYCWNGLVVHRFAHGITQAISRLSSCY